MKIEHLALQVADPAAAARWYVEHLGFSVCRGSDGPVVGRFLADDGGTVLLEIYRNPERPVPDYPAMDPVLLHVALVCDDVPGTVRRLVAAGATLVSGPETSGSDELAMLRDPWGLPLQLARRGQPMLAKKR